MSTFRRNALRAQRSYAAMTPTPSLILLVALFWTLPAGAAVVISRTHNASAETVNAALRRSVERAAGSGRQP